VSTRYEFAVIDGGDTDDQLRAEGVAFLRAAHAAVPDNHSGARALLAAMVADLEALTGPALTAWCTAARTYRRAYRRPRLRVVRGESS